ncbi:MAG: hypothetical protein IH897_13125, partial [Planctomycetes bacterium]|nr:hypothetical protein [Planctomycetota bacterium]
AKAIAFARGLPLVGVHHLEGHTYAACRAGFGLEPVTRSGGEASIEAPFRRGPTAP